MDSPDVFQMPITSRLSNNNLRSNNEAPAVKQSQADEEQQQPTEQQDGERNSVTTQHKMASGVFRLENFKGDGSQKVESYHKRFDQFKVCTGVTDEQGLATLTWHLDPEPQTLGALRDLMLAKFKKPKQINMNVYSMTQQTGESV